jgi:hypothetical protein
MAKFDQKNVLIECILNIFKLVQCDDSIDSNIAHHYYANIKKKFKIPALWVLLKFLGQVPIEIFLNFLDVKKHKIAIARSLCILAIWVRCGSKMVRAPIGLFKIWLTCRVSLVRIPWLWVLLGCSFTDISRYIGKVPGLAGTLWSMVW